MLHTIGHGTRPLPIFLDLLEKYSISWIVDVRSIPWSAYNPQYRKDNLIHALHTRAIHYIYLGNALGGRPSDPSCYGPDGRIDYTVLQAKPFFQAGLDRIILAWQKNISIALLCSESKPQNCHRSRLIGRILAQRNIPLQHIDENGHLRDQQTLLHTQPLLLQ